MTSFTRLKLNKPRNHLQFPRNYAAAWLVI